VWIVGTEVAPPYKAIALSREGLKDSGIVVACRLLSDDGTSPEGIVGSDHHIIGLALNAVKVFPFVAVFIVVYFVAWHKDIDVCTYVIENIVTHSGWCGSHAHNLRDTGASREGIRFYIIHT
jgi:hypothetical protein